MRTLGEQLRHRAQELGLSDAEVARRAGLAPRRYGHYVTGDREPDLQTLVRICKVLNATPNELLGFAEGRPAKRRTEREKLVDRLLAVANVLDDGQLKLAVRQLEAIVDT
jgi:transcriptional regulator with XRE-family HTH domain